MRLLLLQPMHFRTDRQKEGEQTRNEVPDRKKSLSYALDMGLWGPFIMRADGEERLLSCLPLHVMSGDPILCQQESRQRVVVYVHAIPRFWSPFSLSFSLSTVANGYT